MRFSEIVAKWEEGYRGKFRDEYETYYCTDGGIYENNDELTMCTASILEDNKYNLIIEPKKSYI